CSSAWRDTSEKSTGHRMRVKARICHPHSIATIEAAHLHHARSVAVGLHSRYRLNRRGHDACAVDLQFQRASHFDRIESDRSAAEGRPRQSGAPEFLEEAAAANQDVAS